MRLICSTIRSDYQDESGCDYAMITLDAVGATELLAYRDRCASLTALTHCYRVTFFRHDVEAISLTEVPEPLSDALCECADEWSVLPAEIDFPEAAMKRIETCLLEVGERDVYWSFRPKHGSMGSEHETEILTWERLTAIAEGRDPKLPLFPLPDGAPAATGS